MRIITNGDYSNVGLGRSSIGSLTALLYNYFSELEASGHVVSVRDEARLLRLCTRIDDAGLARKIRHFYPFLGTTEASQKLNLTGGNPLTFGGVSGSYALSNQGFEIAGGYTQEDRGYADTGIILDSTSFGMLLGIKGFTQETQVKFAGTGGSHARGRAILLATGTYYQGIAGNLTSFIHKNLVTDPARNLTVVSRVVGTTNEASLFVNDINGSVSNTSASFDPSRTTSLYIGKSNETITESSQPVIIQHFGVTEYLEASEVLILNSILSDYNNSRLAA